MVRIHGRRPLLNFEERACDSWPEAGFHLFRHEWEDCQPAWAGDVFREDSRAFLPYSIPAGVTPLQSSPLFSLFLLFHDIRIRITIG